MTFFEENKQLYLNNKKIFDGILNLKNEQYLIEYLGEAETKILKVVFKTFVERLKNHKKGIFYPRSILTTEAIKKQTGLSYYRQRNAIENLELKFNIINYIYDYISYSLNPCRAFAINFECIENFYYHFLTFKGIFVQLKKYSKNQLINIVIDYENRLSYCSNSIVAEDELICVDEED